MYIAKSIQLAFILHDSEIFSISPMLSQNGSNCKHTYGTLRKIEHADGSNGCLRSVTVIVCLCVHSGRGAAHTRCQWLVFIDYSVVD